MEYICTDCTLKFSKHSNLRSHLKKLHPDKLDVVAPNKIFKCGAMCNICGIRFSKYSNLKRHVAKFHPENVNELTSQKNYPYQCSECQKNFSHLHNLKSHQKIHVRDIDIEKKTVLKCSLCDYTHSLKSNLILHFEEYHNIKIERQDLHFSNELEFQKWRTNWEKTNYSSYVTYSHPYTTTEGTKTSTYICHRSGFYVKKGHDMRHIKTQGSKKINGICPSQLKVKILENGTVKVHFIQTHIGHDNNLGHLNITDNEKMEIASKIASKIPLASILDDVRDSVTNNKLARMHLLTRKDLHNISQSFKLNSEGIRHKNEVVSIESWIHEVQDTGIILFYKAQGVVCHDFPCLKKEDFLLIFMHPGQLEVLQKYSEDVICIDGTHGLNAHDFELTTLLILDDMREGFPCCFMIGNRSDEEIMIIFFTKIKDKLERTIKPLVFMSDMAQYYYSAWLQIMNPAKFRLFCSWHVDRAWRKNLNKVDSEEQKVIVYKQLRTLLQETDGAMFTDMLQNFLTSLFSSAKTQEFGEYFQKYYLNNVETWAYCYRLYAGINTNMSIERMHQTIKYLYLNGKQVRRLDKTINTLMKLIKDKLFERLITLNKGKVSSKIRELRKRHKNSHDLDMGTVVLSEMGWEVPSSSTNELYLVQKNKLNCNCRLVCTSCEACLHSYSCTCLDNSVKWNMCKHIHLVCQFTKGDKIYDTENRSEDEEQNLDYVDEARIKRASEQDKLVEVLNKSNCNPDRTAKQLEIEKQKLILLQMQLIQNISSFEQLEAFKNITAPLEPTLRVLAVHTENQQHAGELSRRTENIPHNKRIIPQKRLFSTKKKSRKPRKNLLSKPEAIEANLIANVLLNPQNNNN